MIGTLVLWWPGGEARWNSFRPVPHALLAHASSNSQPISVRLREKLAAVREEPWMLKKKIVSILQ